MQTAFLDVLDRAAKSVWILGVPRIQGEVLLVQDDDLLFEVALAPLWRAVRDLPPAEWFPMVRERLRTVVQTMRNEGSATADLLSWRFRVAPAWEPNAAAGVVSLTLPEGLEGFVVRPTPDGGLLYFPASAATVHGGRKEVLGAAIEQTISAEIGDLSVVDGTEDAVVIRSLSKSGSPYVSAVLLSLPRFLPVATTSAFVALPGYDEILLAAWDGTAHDPVEPVFRAVAQRRHAASAVPCSPGTFRWEDGHFTPQ